MIDDVVSLTFLYSATQIRLVGFVLKEIVYIAMHLMYIIQFCYDTFKYFLPRLFV